MLSTVILQHLPGDRAKLISRVVGAEEKLGRCGSAWKHEELPRRIQSFQLRGMLTLLGLDVPVILYHKSRALASKAGPTTLVLYCLLLAGHKVAELPKNRRHADSVTKIVHNPELAHAPVVVS
jgi:hypothetical protein